MAIENTLADTNQKVSNKTSKVFNHGNNKSGKLNGMMDNASGIQKNVAGTIVGGGRIIAKAAGALGASGLAKALTGSTKIRYKKTNETSFLTGLKGFYSHFSNDYWPQLVDTIDPFQTFECTFEFSPSIAGIQTRDVTKLQRTVANVDYYYGSEFKKDIEDPTILEEKTTVNEIGIDTSVLSSTVLCKMLGDIYFNSIDFKNGDNEEWKELATQPETQEIFSSSKLLDGDEDSDYQSVKETSITESTTISERSGNIFINLGIYIQRITVPSMTIQGGEDIQTLLGKFPTPGNLFVPDNNTLTMEIINTENPVIEKVFYPWMRETTLPFWCYPSQPFTTANITIDFKEHSSIKYIFYNCRPTQVMLIQPDQSQSFNMTRSVTFTFDFMQVQDSNHEAKDVQKWKKVKFGSGPSNGNSNTGLANAALFSAANTFRM